MGLTPPFLQRFPNSMVSKDWEGQLREITRRDELEQSLRMGSCTTAALFSHGQLHRLVIQQFLSLNILDSSQFISLPFRKYCQTWASENKASYISGQYVTFNTVLFYHFFLSYHFQFPFITVYFLRVVFKNGSGHSWSTEYLFYIFLFNLKLCGTNGHKMW